MIKVLVVDDSALVRKLLGQVFSAEPDFEVRFARNGLEALEQLEAFAPDVVTLDVHMPEMDGLACLDRIMVERPCPVVMVSSLTAEGAEATLEALRLGAVDFVPKPGGAVSLHMDRLAPELVAKVRAAAGAKLRSSLRLRERVRHRIGAARPARRPRARRAAARRTARRHRRGPGSGRDLHRRTAGAGGAAGASAGRLSMADRGRPAHARDLHRALARRLDGHLRHARDGSGAAAAPEPALRLYRPRRRRRDRLAPRRRADSPCRAGRKPAYPWHPSADRLVRSAMEHLPRRRS